MNSHAHRPARRIMVRVAAGVVSIGRSYVSNKEDVDVIDGDDERISKTGKSGMRGSPVGVDGSDDVGVESSDVVSDGGKWLKSRWMLAVRCRWPGLGVKTGYGTT